MIDKYRLKYSIAFYNDFEEIISYIKYELKNEIAAMNLVNKVEKAIMRRIKNPIVYQKYETKEGNIYYKIYINNFVIFYTINENSMEIRRMAYNKRDITKLI